MLILMLDTWLITSKVRICPASRHHLAVGQVAYAAGWSGSWDALKFRGKSNELQEDMDVQ